MKVAVNWVIMRIIGTEHIEVFCRKHAASRRHFDRWLQTVAAAPWKKWADTKQTYARASKAGLCVVFDVQGGAYRLVTRIAYDLEVVSVLSVMTHAEYDKGKWKDECQCN
jgi:mRNA interferase HigB